MEDPLFFILMVNSVETISIIDDLLELGVFVQNSIGFDYVNVASGQNYSVKEQKWQFKSSRKQII